MLTDDGKLYTTYTVPARALPIPEMAGSTGAQARRPGRPRPKPSPSPAPVQTWVRAVIVVHTFHMARVRPGGYTAGGRTSDHTTTKALQPQSHDHPSTGLSSQVEAKAFAWGPSKIVRIQAGSFFVVVLTEDGAILILRAIVWIELVDPQSP